MTNVASERLAVRGDRRCLIAGDCEGALEEDSLLVRVELDVRVEEGSADASPLL